METVLESSPDVLFGIAKEATEGIIISFVHSCKDAIQDLLSGKLSTWIPDGNLTVTEAIVKALIYLIILKCSLKFAI